MIIMMTLIIIRVRCDDHHNDNHHHLDTVRSSSFVYDAIICVRCEASMCDASVCDSSVCDASVCDAFVWDASRCNGAWVTRPERPKGVKDVINQARRAAS